MTAIFKKELASYLHSVTGWLFMAATIGFLQCMHLFIICSMASLYSVSIRCYLNIIFCYNTDIVYADYGRRAASEDRSASVDITNIYRKAGIGEILVNGCDLFNSGGDFLPISIVFKPIWFCSNGGVLCGNPCLCSLWFGSDSSRNVYFQFNRKFGDCGSNNIWGVIFNLYDAGNQKSNFQHRKFAYGISWNI